jgi:FdhD protein
MSQPLFTSPVKNTHVIYVNNNQKTTSQENVVSEASILLIVNGEEWFNFLCTPTDLEELSAGFLFSSQIIKNADEICSLEMCANGSGIDIWLSHPAEKPRLWQRNSGCSGGISIPEVKLEPVTDVEKFLLSPLEINEILNTFYKNQKVYQSSGGVHASALFSKTNLLYLTEDIGRHNTLDKIAGKMLLSPVDARWPILVTSGRISVEMMQKASMIRSCFVISRTSPTSASVDLADQLGITLIGYAEKDRFKVYTHPEQIA